MRSGRKGEERRECILNSTPLESFFLFYVFHYSRNQRRREKGIYSKFHPPSNLLLFFVFHSSKTQRRREKGIYSKFYPPRIFFCFLYFIIRRSEE